MADIRVLEAGQWLALENKVRVVKMTRRGWQMIDTTGAVYDERDHPDGFVTWDEPTDGTKPGPHSVWPSKVRV